MLCRHMVEIVTFPSESNYSTCFCNEFLCNNQCSLLFVYYRSACWTQTCTLNRSAWRQPFKRTFQFFRTFFFFFLAACFQILWHNMPTGCRVFFFTSSIPLDNTKHIFYVHIVALVMEHQYVCASYLTWRLYSIERDQVLIYGKRGNDFRCSILSFGVHHSNKKKFLLVASKWKKNHQMVHLPRPHTKKQEWPIRDNTHHVKVSLHFFSSPYGRIFVSSLIFLISFVLYFSLSVRTTKSWVVSAPLFVCECSCIFTFLCRNVVEQ